MHPDPLARPWRRGDGYRRHRAEQVDALVPAAVGIAATVLALSGGATLVLRFLFGG